MIILVIGIFRPIVLSGIPILFAVISFLGGTTVIAGVTGLFVALLANFIWLTYRLSKPIQDFFEDEQD
jgi:type IV secretory pathway VirB3-like protein